MRQLVVPPVRVKAPGGVDGALHAVFGPAMLRRVHGPSTRAGAFENGARTFSFKVDVDDVPPVIRRFFCGSHVRVTTRQTLTQFENRTQVSNRMKFHFVGAELFSLRPTFWLDDTPEGVFLGGLVRHDARLPPPLNGVAEAFMVAHSERELRHFGRCLAAEGVIEPPEEPPGSGAGTPR